MEVSPSFDPAHAFGGPVTSTRDLCRALATDPSVSLRVLTTDAAHPQRLERLDVPTGWHRHTAGFLIRYCRTRRGPTFSPELLWRLIPAVWWADAIHLNAVYSSPTPVVLLLARLMRRPVLWSPRGALMEPGHGSHRLKVWWDRLCRLLADHRRVVFLATGDGEVDSVRRHFPAFPVEHLRHGVDCPPQPVPWPPFADNGLRLMFLGRLHPMKGLENLIAALALARTPVHLTVYGDGPDDYSTGLKALAERLGVAARIDFAGFLAPDQRRVVFARHHALILSSHGENFGMVVAEALAHGRPVIASTATPWQGLETYGCGLWVDNRPETLGAAIDRLATMDLAAMGQRGHRWMRDDHGWRQIATAFLELARQLAQSPVKICIVSSIGGHLSEIRALSKAYAHLDHFYVLNETTALPPDMADRTYFIRHAERDWKTLVNFWEFWRIFRRERPDIILSTGAGPAVPAAIVGRWLFGCRVIFVETIARVEVPSLTARLIRPFADHLFVQWPDLRRHLPGSRYAGRVI